jgi:hypothetical protein
LCIRFKKAGLQCSGNFQCPSGSAVTSTATITSQNFGGGGGAKKTSDQVVEANIVLISDPTKSYGCTPNNTGTTWSVTCNTSPLPAGSCQLIVRFQTDGMCASDAFSQ